MAQRAHLTFRAPRHLLVETKAGRSGDFLGRALSASFPTSSAMDGVGTFGAGLPDSNLASFATYASFPSRSCARTLPLGLPCRSQLSPTRCQGHSDRKPRRGQPSMGWAKLELVVTGRKPSTAIQNRWPGWLAGKRRAKAMVRESSTEGAKATGRE